MNKRRKALDGKVIIPFGKNHRNIVQECIRKIQRRPLEKLTLSTQKVANDNLDDIFSPRTNPQTESFRILETITHSFPIVTYNGPLTNVPVETPVVSFISEPTINSIPPVPPALETPEHIQNILPTACKEISGQIDPTKKASMIVGVTDLLMRICKQRVTGRDLALVSVPLLTALVACLYNRNDNLKSFHTLASKCQNELLRRFKQSNYRLETNLGVIKKTRGHKSFNLWALLHCFSRCAQCKRHTTLFSDYKHNNGNVRLVQFYTRRCGCALRYCPSCVEGFFLDKKNNKPKDTICWMCTDNQEYGFDHWMVKVPLETVCAVNEETNQHACCLFEPCVECLGNKRPAEAHFKEKTRLILEQLRANLKRSRTGIRILKAHNQSECSFCSKTHHQDSLWTFEGCLCLASKPTYHTACARRVAVSFENTCPFCSHQGFFKHTKR